MGIDVDSEKNELSIVWKPGWGLRFCIIFFIPFLLLSIYISFLPQLIDFNLRMMLFVFTAGLIFGAIIYITSPRIFFFENKFEYKTLFSEIKEIPYSKISKVKKTGDSIKSGVSLDIFTDLSPKPFRLALFKSGHRKTDIICDVLLKTKSLSTTLKRFNQKDIQEDHHVKKEKIKKSNLSRKEFQCDKCNRILSKKEMKVIGTINQGVILEGEASELCETCFTDSITKSFEHYEHRAVAIYPMKNYNYYLFYNINDLENRAYPQKFIDEIKNLLPPPGSLCEKCGSSAVHYSWCSPEIYQNNPRATRLNISKLFGKTFLCGSCLAKEFIDIVKKEQLPIRAFVPPIDSDGFCTSD